MIVFAVVIITVVAIVVYRRCTLNDNDEDPKVQMFDHPLALQPRPSPGPEPMYAVVDPAYDTAHQQPQYDVATPSSLSPTTFINHAYDSASPTPPPRTSTLIPTPLEDEEDDDEDVVDMYLHVGTSIEEEIQAETAIYNQASSGGPLYLEPKLIADDTDADVLYTTPAVSSLVCPVYDVAARGGANPDVADSFYDNAA